MVKETGAWSESEAVYRCSLLPARILEGTSPMMRLKGRLQVGCDADIAVIDADRFTDNASFERPETSSGVRHLLVAGQRLISDGVLDPHVMPGRAVKNTAAG